MLGQLYELVYVSSAVQPMTKAELNALLEVSRKRNHASAISGMLLYAGGTFVQVLEGDEKSVRALYQHICVDSRHSDVTVIHEGPIAKRNFPDWKMGFRYLEPRDFERREGFTDLLREGSPAAAAFREKPNLSHRLLMSFGHAASATDSDNR